MATKSAAKVAGGVKIISKATQDVFAGVAKEVENLDQEKAYVLATALIEDVESNQFKLGGVLAHIQDEASKEGGEAWLDGLTNFREVIEVKFGLHYRKAMYLVGIYTDLVTKQIPWESVSALGWTKLKELTPILTPKNVDGWVKKAKGMTVLQLIEAIKSVQSKKGSDATESTKPAVTTITFKVHPDQKESIREALDKVKEETNTDVDTVALFNLAQGYLGNTISITKEEAEGEEDPAPAKGKKGKAAAVDIKSVMKDLGVEKVLEAFGEVFPDVDVAVTM